MDRDNLEIEWEEAEGRPGRGGEPQRIGDVLAELLALYQTRFPGLRITVVETPVAAA